MVIIYQEWHCTSIWDIISSTAKFEGLTEIGLGFSVKISDKNEREQEKNVSLEELYEH